MPAQSGGKESKIETYKGLEHFNRRFRYTGLLIASAEGFGLAPCILPENLCSTFWQQESPAARSLGLHMSRPANSPGRSYPTPLNIDEMN